MPCRDLDAPASGGPERWWPGGGRPHFGSSCAASVAPVTDQSSPDTPPDQDRPGIDDPDLADRVSDATAAMDDVRRQVAEAPAEVVVVNHVMGLYELAAIHLSAPTPDLGSAALAIDAVACLVDGLGDRLGPDAATMRDALNNIRLAFVQIKGRVTADAGSAAEPSGG